MEESEIKYQILLHHHTSEVVEEDTVVENKLKNLILPKTCLDFLQMLLPNPDLLNQEPNLSKPTSARKSLLKYSGTGLLYGRPLDSTIILTFGQSGGGKSTLINKLFDDPTLCETSSYKSQTKLVTFVRKELTVTSENPNVTCWLNFVDVPGIFDSEGNEAMQFTEVKQTFKKHPALASRSEFTSILQKIPNIEIRGLLQMRIQVYPNMILFVIKAGDNRKEGANSFLSKSLKALKILDVVDKNRPNLIVVVTHAGFFGSDKESFEKECIEWTLSIQKVVDAILDLSNVTVVFIEEDHKKFRLEKSSNSDYYKLPNGELSHGNLITAIFDNFSKNKDLLSMLLVSWYFDPSCPDRVKKAEREIPIVVDDPQALQQTLRDLKNLQIITSQPEELKFNFQALGHGYCPVNEIVKSCYLLPPNSSQKKIKIENTEFLIPECVNANVKREIKCEVTTFHDRSEYQDYRRKGYAIDGSLDLVVGGSSNGRWIEEESVTSAATIIHLVYEIQIASLRLNNPWDLELNPKFLTNLNQLPKTLKNNNEQEFNAFFGKFGTHMICEQSIGGAVQFDCEIEQSKFDKESQSKIKFQVASILSKCIKLTANIGIEKEISLLREIGISNEKLKIVGGSFVSIVSFEDLIQQPQILQEWSKTVSRFPSELIQSIKLEPYYNFSNKRGQHALRNATALYLKHVKTNFNKIDSLRTRKETADKFHNKAKKATCGYFTDVIVKIRDKVWAN